MTAAVPVVLGYLLDAVVGDPPRRTHPVVLMGRLAAGCEALARRFCRGVVALRLAGCGLAVLVPGLAFLGGAAAVTAAREVHPWLATAVSAWLISTAVARRGLAEAALAVYGPLAAGDLARARERLAPIVGRDTDRLPAREVTRGAVETVAENTVDAVVAPLFYALLGGPALALAYRAANTLDAMVGYRREFYRDFGWASARLDDVLNYVPARLTGLLMLAAARLLGLDWRAGLEAVWRDARRHPSPNAGIPEAAVAGALGVRLGGWNRYGGIPSFRAYLGEGRRELEAGDIPRAVRLMSLTSHLALALGVAAAGVVRLLASGSGWAAIDIAWT